MNLLPSVCLDATLINHFRGEMANSAENVDANVPLQDPRRLCARVQRAERYTA